MCTCPIKSGAAWVHDTKPDLDKYKVCMLLSVTEFWLTLAQVFNGYTGTLTHPIANGVRVPDAFFTMSLDVNTDDIDEAIQYNPMEQVVPLSPPRHGKFLHVKFISSNQIIKDSKDTPNIDIGFIGFGGFETQLAADEAAAAAALPLEHLEDIGLARRFVFHHQTLKKKIIQ